MGLVSKRMQTKTIARKIRCLIISVKERERRRENTTATLNFQASDRDGVQRDAF